MAVADEYLIKGTTMTTIADAIRIKSGSTGELSCPTGMVTAINSIKEPYPNGTKWTKSAATTAVSFADVCYGNGIWVAASSGDKSLFWSTDGKNWTSAGLTIPFAVVAYADGLWLAGSYDNGIYYSEDGKTWTQSSLTTNSCILLYKSGTYWIAGLADNGICYSNSPKTKWSRSTALTSSTIFSVYCADGIWVTATGDQGLWYSTNGYKWSSGTVSAGSWRDVYFADGLWIACGNPGICRSANGRVWVPSNITSACSCVCRNNGIWVAGGNVGNGLYYSSDGTTWTASNITTGSFNYLYYSNGVWIACGKSSSNGLYYSTDGQTWTQCTEVTMAVNKVCNENGIWVAAGGLKSLYYSITWEP